MKSEAGADKLERLVEVLASIKRDVEDNPMQIFTPNTAKGFQEAFLNSKKRFRVVFAGNRSGKSMLNAYEVCRFATGTHPLRKLDVPNVGWVVSPDARLSSTIMQKYVKYFLGKNLKKEYKKDMVFGLKNGSEIHFKSCDSDISKFTGASIYYGAIDEDCPEDVFKEVFVRTIDRRGDLWITLTPLYSTWMYEKIYLRQFTDPELEVFFGSTFENLKYVSMQEVERMKNIYSKDELQARLYGKFLFFQGLVYKEFDERKHVVQPFKIPDDWVRMMFIDHGIYDPTCCLWVAVNPENEYFVYREYYKSDLTIQENVRNIKMLTGNEKIKYIWIDSTTDRRSSQTRTTDYRIYVESGLYPLLKAPRVAVDTKINNIKDILRLNKLKIFKTCTNTIKEFLTHSYTKLGVPDKTNDHAIDCVSYICSIKPVYRNVKQTLPTFLKTATFDNNLYLEPNV